MISVNYAFGGGVITVTNAKSSAESEKFTLKIRSESGKLFTNGCHFPPKSTNFGTLLSSLYRNIAFIDKRWRMFSKMFMMNMLLKMIIYAKVCIIFFFKPKRYQKILTRFDI